MEPNVSNAESRDVKSYSIALLMSDLTDAKRISGVFKQLGIVPFLCKSESEFFITCEQQKPHLSIVDVKKISENFSRHELVMKNSLALVFFYNLGSKPRLNETYDIFNYGYINGHQDLGGQIKSILNRFNHMERFRYVSQEVEGVQKKFEDKTSRIVDQVQKLKEKDFYHTFYRSICARLDLERDKSDDFMTAISRVFSTVKEIKQFTVLELSTSGHKLVSPKMHFDKYKEIPSLWLGRSCAQGIEFFAQNMASQVCLELLGGDLMSILIRGRKKNPDLMLFLQVEDEDFISHFSWETFESYLSGLYCHFALKESTVNQTSQQHGNYWSLLSLADELGNGVIPSSRVEGGLDRYSLLKIDFTALVTRASENVKERFFWQKFFSDFFNGLENRNKVTFKLYSHSLQKVILLIDKKDEATTKKEVELYARKFPYWRYFEQSDLVLNERFDPSISYVDLSLNTLLPETTVVKTSGPQEESKLDHLVSQIRPPSFLSDQTM